MGLKEMGFKDGHAVRFVKNVSERKQKKTKNKQDKGLCYQCGDEGHKSRDCPQKKGKKRGDVKKIFAKQKSKIGGNDDDDNNKSKRRNCSVQKQKSKRESNKYNNKNGG